MEVRSWQTRGRLSILWKDLSLSEEGMPYLGCMFIQPLHPQAREVIEKEDNVDKETEKLEKQLKEKVGHLLKAPVHN